MPAYVTWGLLAVGLAFVFYTWGIWGPRRSRDIKPLHATFLWLGLLFDSGGTGLMAAEIGYYQLDAHGIIGTLAIALMAASAVWATYALWIRDANATTLYLKWAVWVWALWLLPYVYGIVAKLR